MLSFKKYYDKYDDYIVYLVDEQEVRGIDLKLEEFTNYAIHSDFAIIPKNEIWLSREVNRDEKFFIIAEALARIKYKLQGISDSKAYDRALVLDKTLRRKDLHSRHINIPTKNKVPPEIYLEKYGIMDDVEIWIVDGELVRDFWKTDWIEGGHDYVYHFIPRGEIWIDSEVPSDERMLIIIHETTERDLMRIKHMAYNKAHEKASKIEWRFRKLRTTKTNDATNSS